MRTVLKDWTPIPSVEGTYEINERGEVRNTKTKKLLKPEKQVKKIFSQT